MKRRIKINGMIIALAVLSLAAFPTVFLRRNLGGLWEEAIEILGIVFILLGQLIRVSARGYKSEHSSDGHTLIQGGPYALVRNPMYLGILLIGLGVVFFLFKWWVACIFLFIFIIRYLPLMLKEEKELLSAFGDTCQDYYKKVPRILPSLSMILKTDINECLPLKLSWLKKEIGAILAVLLIVVFIESWEDIRNEGIGIYIWESVILIIAFMLFIGLLIYLVKKTGDPKKNVSDKSKINL
jgi:protein-S-isoprenylcysteine O-methyltransferase Ste14